MAIGWHVVNAQDMNGWQWRAGLLKFYPFRTFDAMLPIVAGMFVALILQHGQPMSEKNASACRSLSSGTANRCCLCIGKSRRLDTPLNNLQTGKRRVHGFEAKPNTALFLTPRESFAFKWFAERAEYVCYKDCPQDAAGILEWNRRLWWLHDWTLKSSTDGVYDRSDLEELRAKTDCDYILTRILGPFDTAPVWQGKHWQIIKVP